MKWARRRFLSLGSIRTNGVVLLAVAAAALAACSGAVSEPGDGDGPRDDSQSGGFSLLGSTLDTLDSGGWITIDFTWRDDPLLEARRCVESRAGAVQCFAFASEDEYRAARPVAAGNFTGLSCWDATWKRNKLGDESGFANGAKDSGC